MSSVRGGFGGIAIVFLFAVVAFGILLALSAVAPASNSGTPAPTGARPPVLTGEQIPSQYRLHPGGMIALTDLGTTPATAAPPGAPGPAPTDLPFAPNLAVTTDPAPDHRPSMARDGQGRTYIAYQHEVTPTNHDIYISWSDNDGRTWSTPLAIAATGADETNPNLIVTTGDRVTVFLQQNANTAVFAYAQSADRGGSWTTSSIGTGGAPLVNFEYPSFAPAGAGAQGMWGVFCTSGTSCGGGAWTVIMLFSTDVSQASGWTATYFAQTPSVELFHPSSGWNSVTNDLVGGIEIEIFDNTAWDLTWFRFNGVTNFFAQDGLMCGNFCPSNTFVWPSMSVDGNRAVVGADFFNTSLAPNFEILAVYSTNTPGGAASWNLVNTMTGTIDNAASDKKYVSFDLKGTQVSAAYWKAASPTAAAAWFVSGINTGATFQTPARVSDNTPATAIDQVHAIVVRNSTAGALVAWHDSRDGNPNIYFAGFQRYAITIATNPANLLVRFDSGAFQPAPATASFPSGTSHTIECQSPQAGGPGVQYVFTQWTDGNTNDPRTISVAADTTYTCSLGTQFQITVASAPAGRTVTVNAAPQTAPYNFWCDASAQASLGAPSPQTVTPTSQYRFNSWSDNLAQTHSITCDQPRTFTANFVLQYQVTIATNPAGRDIVVDNIPQVGPYLLWCDDASTHSISAPGPQAVGPGSQYRYDTWSDIGAQTHTITCTSATTITANFVLQYQITLNTNPAGRDLTVDGTPRVGPYSAYWDVNANFGVLVPSPQAAGVGTRYTFSAWNDGNPSPSRTVVADSAKQFTAIFTTEYFLTISTNAGTVNPSNGWHPASDIVSISTTGPLDGATDRYRFDRWSGDFVGFSTSDTIIMDAPKVIRANWVHQYRIEIRSNVAGASITVDGTPRNVIIVDWWNDTSVHSLVAPASMTIGGNERWNFASWTGGSTNPSLSVTVSGSTIYTATYSHQFLITVATNPTSGPTLLVDGAPYTGGALWWDENSPHTIDANSPQSGGPGVRYVWSAWACAPTACSATASQAYTVTAAGTFTATYTTQYFLTVTSDYGNPTCANPAGTGTGGYWYDAGSNARCTVTTPFQAGGTKFALVGWGGAATGSAPTAQVTMDGAKTITASWREVSFVEEYGALLGILIAIIVAVILVLLLLMRRRKKEPAVPPPAAMPAQAAQPSQAGGTKTCPACGMEIPAGASTCPVCGSAV